MKTLQTNRIEIIPLNKQDFSEIIKMYLEPDSNKYIRPLQGKTETEFLQFLEKKLSTNQSLKGLGFWTCRLKSNGNFIGTCNLNPFFETERIQIGCHLSSHYWNKGYAFEILQEIVKHGTEDLKLKDLYGFFEPENSTSGKLMNKLSFEFLGKEKHFGIELNVHKYASNKLD